MDLRRALLLFAIVLGLAALAASLSGPVQRADRPKEPAQPAPSAERSPAQPEDLRFAASRPRRRGLPAGSAAEVLVSVDSPGMVEIPGLGMSASADPVTPARFEVLEEQPGRYPIRFVPAGGPESWGEPAGTLVIRATDRPGTPPASGS